VAALGVAGWLRYHGRYRESAAARICRPPAWVVMLA
jgi:hypothetical protein